MEVFKHEHPLNLIDLEQKCLRNEEEDDEDDDDNNLVLEEDFRCRCNLCSREINVYHRFYYKCSIDLCGYSIHKFCAEAPPTFNLVHHEHTLYPQMRLRQLCDVCRTTSEVYIVYYSCRQCFFDMCITCTLAPDEAKIYHPCHTHPLATISKPILCECRACGRKHEGSFYMCVKCSYFFIHKDCALLPKKLFIQYTTNGEFSHSHALTLSYSFPFKDRSEKYDPCCRVCDMGFTNDGWVYKCDKCWFYTHVDCATSKKEPFMSILSSSPLGKLYKNYEDAKHPDVVPLPFADETNNVLKHIFSKTSETSPTFGSDDHENLLTHMSHKHPLILVDVSKPTSSSSTSGSKTLLPSCHDPMKRIELLCNGCLRPITSMPFYKCSNIHDGDEQCNSFVLHEWCTRLPGHIENHPGHPQHTLALLSKAPHKFMGVFVCEICQLRCNGFVYSCVKCDYHMDLNCAFMPEKIIHLSHPDHLMLRVQSKPCWGFCRACLDMMSSNGFSYSCKTCYFDLHIPCALLLPNTMRHRLDKHHMKLSYSLVENHKHEYFCEICEVEFNPNRWFYHCYECVQSIHLTCAPIILECEKATMHWRLFPFVNMKFGGIYNIEDHPHPTSFVQQIKGCVTCAKCNRNSGPWYENLNMFFKCLQCKFGLHFVCCKQFNNW